MSITISSNIASLQAVRRLSTATASLGRTFERLATGLRINRGSDDPAGLSVSSLLDVNARIFRRGQANVNDAVSLLNIADGSLNEVSNVTQRMIELSEQAANGSLTLSQRTAIYQEYNALEHEVRRISNTTTFNGLNLLKGERSSRQAETLFNNLGGAGYSTPARPISADGRYVSYGDAIGQEQYVKDRITGTTKAIPTSGSMFGQVVLQNGDLIYAESNLFDAVDLKYFNFETGQVTVLTASQSISDTTRFAVSADGRYAIFNSRTRYVDGGTKSSATGAGANDRLYRVDLTTGIYRAINADVAGINNLELSADGQWATFRSTSNLTGQNADANNEIFVLNYGGSSLAYQQVTNTTGASAGSPLAVGTDGRVVFSSTRDFTGENGAGLTQLFSVTTSGEINQKSQLTASIAAARITISADLSAAYFLTTANLTGDSNGQFQLYHLDLGSRTIERKTDFSAANALDGTGYYVSADGRGAMFTDAGGSGQNARFIDLSPEALEFNFEAGHGATGMVSSALDSLIGALGGLNGFVLYSQFSARHTLAALKGNLASIAELRGNLGASISRLQVADSVLTTQELESTTASSRIKDADISEESARLVRQNIIQQAGAAILAQANTQPQLALLLLGRI